MGTNVQKRIKQKQKGLIYNLLWEYSAGTDVKLTTEPLKREPKYPE